MIARRALLARVPLLLGAGLPLAARAAGGTLPATAAAGETVAWPRPRTLDGQPLEAPWQQGLATVLVFYSTDCGYCHRHLPRVQRLAAGPAGAALLAVGVAHDREADAVRQHAQRLGLDRLRFTLDERPLHAVLSQRRITPLTCVIDRGGRLREVIPGEMTEDDVLGLARWTRT